MGGSREGTLGPDPPGKSQITICFLKNTGMDLFKEQLDPLGSNCFLREVHTTLFGIC